MDLSRVRLQVAVLERLGFIDLASAHGHHIAGTAPKWKHGWIPLNAAAEAILHAKAEHGATLSHEQLLALNLGDLKKHYSETIKAHPQGHLYVKKVGKAVGSHPESLAKTKATLAAKKDVTEPEQSPIEKVQAHSGATDVTMLKSTEGQHVGFVVQGKAQTEGKKHAVYSAQGNYVGDVNSFTGAQHLVGEQQLGKPKPPHKLTGQPVTDVVHMTDAPVGTTVTYTSQPMHQYETEGTKHSYTKTGNDTWLTSDGLNLTDDQFKGTIAKGTLTWGGTKVEPKPKTTLPPGSHALGDGYTVNSQSSGNTAVYAPGEVEAGYTKYDAASGQHAAYLEDPGDDGGGYIDAYPTAEQAAKAIKEAIQAKEAMIAGSEEPPLPPEKIKIPKFTDPAPPEPPSFGGHGWAAQGATDLDKAPVGTAVSHISGQYKWVKLEDGTWQRYHKIGGEWSKPGGSYYSPQTSTGLANAYLSLFWGSTGPNTAAPSGYDGPKYGIAQHPSGKWAVKDYYSNGWMPGTLVSGKPNASKKANDLNKAAGTLTAAQKKAQFVQEHHTAQATQAFAVGGAKPGDLGHPTLPVGASDEQQKAAKYDPAKVGQVKTTAFVGQPTHNSTLFGSGYTSASAKQHTMRRISDRMEQHYGMASQEQVDQAWLAMAKAGVFSDQAVPQTFNGSADNAFGAYPSYSETGGDIKRGTPEYRQVMREKMVAHLIQLWAQSSNDTHAISLSLQDIAAELFGVTDQAKWPNVGHVKGEMDKLKGDPGFGKLADAFLRAQYDDTQATLAAKGITKLRVRRGVGAGAHGGTGVGDSGVMKMRPMSSWTTNTGTAVNFGQTIMQTEVPASKVLGFASSGFGCLSEYEVVLIGGQTQARVVKRGNQHATDY